MKYRLTIILLLLVLTQVCAQQVGHVVILGDSNTWIGGDNCDKPKGWNKWFKEALNPQSCRSYARSGATWTNTPETRKDTKENIGILGNNNVIYNQVMRLEEAVLSGQQPQPQLIIILAGTNDAWFADKRPLALSKTAEQAFAPKTYCLLKRPISKIVTLAESVRYDCELLKKICPKAQIVLLTPFESVQAGKGITKVGDMIKACGQKMGFPVIRLDQLSGINAAQEARKPSLTTDGTHTSLKGAQQVGNLVAQQINEILKP